MKMTRFYRTVKAKLTGDTEELLILHNEEMAIVSLDSIIAELNYNMVEAKSDLKSAEAAFDDAKYPKTKIVSKDTFKASLRTTKNQLVINQNKVSQMEFDLKFYKELLAEYKELG